MSTASEEPEKEEDITTTLPSGFLTSDTFDLTKLSMVQVVRDLSKSLSNFRTFFTRNRQIRVEVVGNLDLEALKHIKTLCNYDVTVEFQTQTRSFTPHTQAPNTRTISWGKFFSHELVNCTDEDLLEQLQAENADILLAKRMFRTAADGSRAPSKLIKIKFDTPTIYDIIFCLNLAYNVELYTPPLPHPLKNAENANSMVTG